MKKLASFALMASLLWVSLSQVSAGGGEMSAYYDYGYVNPLSTITETVKDNKIKDILSKNILSIMGNTISEDYEYNSTHFYSKKISLNIVIPDELLTKIKSTYIGFTIQNPMVYEYDIMPKEDTSVTVWQNSVKIDLSAENMPSELTLERDMFESQISDVYGTSFVGNIFLELTDGTVIPFSNTYYFYVNADTSEGKLWHLSNMYYAQYPYSGYADLETLLKKYFEKLEAKMGNVSAYIEALGKISEKVDTMTKKYETAQSELTKNIKSEEDFTAQVELYGKIMQRYNILTDLKWRIGTEIQTRSSEGVLEELFGEE